MHWLIGALVSPAPPAHRAKAMHSEHILKERSDAQNVVSRFPCGMQPFYTTRGASRALF